ncbi:ribonuclease H family protein [Lapidilactobacillus mulanensis]|uniref:ribonuclease H n=1 Tax=Lapidilactobacillus mulanensis TaxID=2485999 RepID=A0ABW4DKV6_9LACO|nr:ribonuclease H family protein [Lapidilactobacillus mulanensis]
MANKKYYAIAKGRQTGIFTDWPTAKKQVDGFTGARYKGFATEAEANQWLAEMATGVNKKAATKQQAAQTTAVQNSENMIQVFTDGGSRNTGNVLGGHVNPDDLAAWAYLIILPDGQRYQGSEGEFGVTNNKMELTALKFALLKLIDLNLQAEPILITSDSHYVLDPIMKNWLAGWQRRNWRKSDGQPVLNLELWQAVSPLLPQFANLQFNWVKGHLTTAGNVFVDELLNQTMDDMKK